MSPLLPGGGMPGVRLVGASVTVMRRTSSSFVVGVEVAWSGRDLHGASNVPGP